MLNNLIPSLHVSSEYQFHQATTGQIHFVRERTVASQERELEVCRRWLFFTYVYGGFSNHKLSWELDWLDFGTVFNPLALESMSQGANLKSMLDLRAALWLVWLVPQPTCCFFQGHMSTLFGSLASKKKGVGEGWSLDTWKRDQGLLMLDKRRSALVETHLFFERRRERLRQLKKKLAKRWRWVYLTSNICSHGQADTELSAPNSPTRKEVLLITMHFFQEEAPAPVPVKVNIEPKKQPVMWVGR